MSDAHKTHVKYIRTDTDRGLINGLPKYLTLPSNIDATKVGCRTWALFRSFFVND